MAAFLGRNAAYSRTIPAATVWWVTSSIRINAPVARISAYASAASACCTFRLMRAMSFSFSPSAGWRCCVLISRMESIAVKIRTRVALTPEEKQFVGSVRTLPVYRLLEWGVRQGVVDSVIGDTDELVALTLAYQMLNDLTRSIDFAVSNAERGAAAAGAGDAGNAKACQTRILTKGIEQLSGLRDDVLRQRAQMRQSYMAALEAANLSANYAGVVRQRDRDARDAAGAAANRNR